MFRSHVSAFKKTPEYEQISPKTPEYVLSVDFNTQYVRNIFYSGSFSHFIKNIQSTSSDIMDNNSIANTKLIYTNWF